jgi:phospholipid transport system substrate-binding protein
VEGNGSPITLRWRVIERGGKWSVVDLEFAGLWLAIEQRAQVSAILDRPGADIEDVIATFG